MIFSVELDNTKVVDNLNIFAALKFDDFRPLGLGAMKFWNSLLSFDCVLYSSGLLCISTLLILKSAPDDN